MIGTLLSVARTAGVPVVYTRAAYQDDYADLIRNSPLLDMVVQRHCLVDGSDSAQIVPELAPAAGDLVITHQRVGAFTASPLDIALRARGIHTVLITGVATNLSVESTARQASDLGYRTIIVTDACSAADHAVHNAAIASLSLLAETTSSTDAARTLISASAPAPSESPSTLLSGSVPSPPSFGGS